MKCSDKWLILAVVLAVLGAVTMPAVMQVLSRLGLATVVFGMLWYTTNLREVGQDVFDSFRRWSLGRTRLAPARPKGVVTSFSRAVR